jgi:hypothetical protein
VQILQVVLVLCLGLVQDPQVIISKEYSQANDWVMYHVSLGNNKKIILNETNAVSTDSCWNNTTPTSSVFSVSGASVVNRNSSTYVYYLFANTSMIKAGSYVGNNGAMLMELLCTQDLNQLLF